jgi:hypothetical protein
MHACQASARWWYQWKRALSVVQLACGVVAYTRQRACSIRKRPTQWTAHAEPGIDPASGVNPGKSGRLEPHMSTGYLVVRLINVETTVEAVHSRYALARPASRAWISGLGVQIRRW